MARRSPTILLVAHQGFAARLLLRTDVLTALRAAGARVVVLAPNADEPYLAAELGAHGAVVERLDADPSMTQESRLWSLLHHLRTFTLARGARAPTLQDKYGGFRQRVAGEQALPVRLLIHAALQLLWRSRTLRRAAVWLERRLFTRRPHREVFERHRPDLVVVTSAGWFHEDAVLLREARAEGVPTAGVVLSWDNPTSKGYRVDVPDLTIAWSETMAQQLVDYQEIPRKRIAVGGVPHFDPYVRDGALLGWEELCERVGLDPQRRLVLYCGSSPGTAVDDPRVGSILADAIESDTLGAPCQLVVRPHPIVFRAGRDVSIAEYERVRDAHRHAHLNIPDVKSDVLRCDLSAEDGVLLTSLVAHAAVMVNVFSTTTLEGFLAGTPVVLVSPELTGAAVPEGGWSRRFDEFTHIRSLVERGAARVARSEPELIEHVRAYLADPQLDAAERAQVIRDELGPTDGRAGERIAGMLLEEAIRSGA